MTAVVVTHSVTRFLGPALRSLLRQSVPVDEVVLVDWGRDAAPIDDLARELNAAGAHVRVHHAPGAPNFGTAVRAALRQHPATSPWLWLWHDDMTAHEDTLANLLRAVERSDSVAVAGVKQRLPGELKALAEVGVTTSRFGKRFTGVQPGDLDQGQLDSREDVLAVGTAGMLILREVWDELGGTDPQLGPYGDGLDLCRRARLAGHRVVVVPSAVVEHAQSRFRNTRGSRRSRGDVSTSMGDRRRAFLFQAHIQAPAALVPLVTVWAVVSGLARALWRIVQEDAGAAWAEISASWWVLTRPGAIRRSRRRAAATARFGRSALYPLMATRRQVRAARKDRKASEAEEYRARTAPSEVELAEKAAIALKRRWTLAALVLILTAVCGVVLLRYAIRGPMWGGALLPADMSLGDLWSAVLSPWIDSGLGSPGPSDPLLAVLLLPAPLCLGNVQVAVSAVMVGAPLLAGVTAWFAAGAGTRRLGVRLLVGLAWAASPTLWVSLAQGRLGAVIAHVMLPLVAVGVARAAGVDRRDVIMSAAGDGRGALVADHGPGSVGAAAAAGLALAVVGAGSPLVMWVGVAIALVLMIVAPRGRRVRMAFVAVVPLVAFAVPIGGALGSVGSGGWWRALIADPGVPEASQAVPTWQLAIGWPAQPSGLPFLSSDLAQALAWLVPAVMLAWALLSTVTAGARWRGCLVGWAVVAAGLGAGVAAVRIAAGSNSTELVSVWAGPAASVAMAGLLVCAVVGADKLALARAGLRRAWSARALAAVFGIAGLAVVATGCAGVATFIDSNVLHTRTHAVVPAIALESQKSAEESRSLLVAATSTDELTWQVARANGPQLTQTAAAVSARAVAGGLGQASAAKPDAAAQFVGDIIARISAGNGYDPSSDLSQAAVAFVVVPPVSPGSDASVSEARSTLVSTLNSTPGLAWVTGVEAGDVWRVNFNGPEDPERPARIRIVDADGKAQQVVTDTGHLSTSVTIPSGSQGRLLTLAERADAGWHATLNGQALKAASGQWNQVFELPASGGALTITYGQTWQTVVQWVTAALLVLFILLALPIRTRREVGRL